jgi:mono/diheme cytochrome c family protein
MGEIMKIFHGRLPLQTLFLFLLTFSLVIASGETRAGSTDKAEMIERGRYLIKITGCNDCHTSGYLMANGETPVSQWLMGDFFGWRGPWGTTYPPNLRLFMKDLSEDEWVQEAKSLKRLPPMPWFNLNAMTDEDLRAVYQFTRSLGKAGKQAPAYVPPGEEPKPPYATFPAPPG